MHCNAARELWTHLDSMDFPDLLPRLGVASGFCSAEQTALPVEPALLKQPQECHKETVRHRYEGGHTREVQHVYAANAWHATHVCSVFP